MDPNPIESRTVFLDQEEKRLWGQEASICLTVSGSGRFHSLLSPQRRLLYHDLILLKKYDIIYKKSTCGGRLDAIDRGRDKAFIL